MDFITRCFEKKGLDKDVLLRNREHYIQSVLESSNTLPGQRTYVVAVLVANYISRSTKEFEFTFTDLEARDPWGKYIPTSKLSALLEDLELLNSLINIYADEEICEVKRYIDFEDVMNKKCRGGHEIESSGVMFLHFNQLQFEMISSITSLEEIEQLTKEVC